MRDTVIVVVVFLLLAIALPRIQRFVVLPTKPMPAVTLLDK
jgi:hypothetical protein